MFSLIVSLPFCGSELHYTEHPIRFPNATLAAKFWYNNFSLIMYGKKRLFLFSNTFERKFRCHSVKFKNIVNYICNEITFYKKILL